MRTLLYRSPAATPIADPPGCLPGRTENTQVIRKGGKLYKMIVRDTVIVEDPYLMMVKAAAYAIRTHQANPSQPIPRTVRDFLIKSSVG